SVGFVRGPDGLEQDGEFGAAESRDRVAIAYGVREALGNPAQHCVANPVTQPVIDELEPVEIDEQYRDAARVAAAARKCVRYAIAEQDAVGESCQCVSERLMCQLTLQADARGDVVETEHAADCVRTDVLRAHVTFEHTAVGELHLIEPLVYRLAGCDSVVRPKRHGVANLREETVPDGGAIAFGEEAGRDRPHFRHALVVVRDPASTVEYEDTVSSCLER